MERMIMDTKVALVTGGSRGIGKAIAERFLKDGFSVVIMDVSAEGITAALESMKGAIRGEVCDVCNPAAVKDLVDKIVQEMGHLDVLVNNAGITRDGLVIRMKPEQWDEVLNINLKGAFICAQAAVRPMMKNDEGGRIINISSVVGLMGNAGQANYSASKAGLIGLTKSLAKEFASRKILVNAVAPGFIETAMTAVLPEDIRQKMIAQIPLAKMGTPTDVAAVCSFLAGPDSIYITGQVITVDGGMVM
jgi:3-oxoacyl-[acyl-carrier protein] reductase